VLSVRGVTKHYGAHTALAGIDLDVDAGEVLGLLGPNGAGKTSLISIVAGLRRPDRGTVHVAGIDVTRAPQRAHEIVGLAPQDTGVYVPLSVRDNLRFFGGLAGLGRRELRERIDAVANALMLDGLMHRRAGELSGGERRRLHTAIALVHRPRLVLLDEPTTGADVATRNALLDVVRTTARDGVAIVYSTHYLPEIEALDANVAFIDQGRIVARGPVDELVRRHGSSALHLVFDGKAPRALDALDAVVDGNSVTISTSDPASTAAHVLAHLGGDAEALRAIEIVRPTLESVFMSVMGRRYAAEEPVPA
jgi:ABC-2 type transport system ATP-binding protein